MLSRPLCFDIHEARTIRLGEKKMAKMNVSIVSVLALGVLASVALAGQAQINPMVGGMAMMANQNIVQNAMNSKDHTTLVAAVKAAGLVDALQAKGPFTVFAPTNDAFENLPEGAVDKLLMPENKMMLSNVLTYHVAKGKWTMKDIAAAIKKGNGKANITMLNGGHVWAMWNGPSNIVLKDEAGMVTAISTYDVMQSNGVIHVTTGVLMPKM
jgi:uncharacterized surface protein with fasciclin (FAS1) repeats